MFQLPHYGLDGSPILPLKKDISAVAILIVQTLFERVVGEIGVSRALFSECCITGTIVNFCCGIRKAPPLVDSCIVPGGVTCYYALFECGLTYVTYGLRVYLHLTYICSFTFYKRFSFIKPTTYQKVFLLLRSNSSS